VVDSGIQRLRGHFVVVPFLGGHILGLMEVTGVPRLSFFVLFGEVLQIYLFVEVQSFGIIQLL
jgi:hypothetical protein